MSNFLKWKVLTLARRTVFFDAATGRLYLTPQSIATFAHSFSDIVDVTWVKSNGQPLIKQLRRHALDNLSRYDIAAIKDVLACLDIPISSGDWEALQRDITEGVQQEHLEKSAHDLVRSVAAKRQRVLPEEEQVKK